MPRIYDAVNQKKREYILLDNDLKSFDKQLYSESYISDDDIALVGVVNSFPFEGTLNISWTLNGIKEKSLQSGDIIVVEKFVNQKKTQLKKVNEVSTTFDSPIQLSEDATILVPMEKYDALMGNIKFRDLLRKRDIRVYLGNPRLAFEMLMFDKGYIFLELGENGFDYTNSDRVDSFEYAKKLTRVIKELDTKIRESKQDVKTEEYNVEINGAKTEEIVMAENARIISGLTSKKQGSEELDDEMFATTDIGKRRKNQEDAFLLIKDLQNPDFKMAVVADGMGGWQYGELASNYIVNSLKEWFEGLTKEQKESFYTGVSALKESLLERIELEIQTGVTSVTWGLGGSTLVCAIVGKNDTLVANVGDSRAYYVKGGDVVQISREDTRAQKHLEDGKLPNKEAARFDCDSNELLQAIGIDRRDLKHPNVVVLNNKDYDMLLLFSDGVTDCLSDDDIAITCSETDKRKLAKKIVDKAMMHDSILPEEYYDYDNVTNYIPGGKDNTTAVVITQNEENEKQEERE